MTRCEHLDVARTEGIGRATGQVFSPKAVPRVRLHQGPDVAVVGVPDVHDVAVVDSADDLRDPIG